MLIAQTEECETLDEVPLQNNEKPTLSEDLVAEKYALMEALVPKILHELDMIDQCMQNVRDLIRPHTTLNRSGDINFPLFSEDFDSYKQCLEYKR